MSDKITGPSVYEIEPVHTVLKMLTDLERNVQGFFLLGELYVVSGDGYVIAKVFWDSSSEAWRADFKYLGDNERDYS